MMRHPEIERKCKECKRCKKARESHESRFATVLRFVSPIVIYVFMLKTITYNVGKSDAHISLQSPDIQVTVNDLAFAAFVTCQKYYIKTSFYASSLKNFQRFVNNCFKFEKTSCLSFTCTNTIKSIQLFKTTKNTNFQNSSNKLF